MVGVLSTLPPCGVYSGTDESNNSLAYEKRIAEYVPKPLTWGGYAATNSFGPSPDRLREDENGKNKATMKI